MAIRHMTAFAVTNEMGRGEVKAAIILFWLFRHSSKSSIAQEERLVTSYYWYQGSTCPTL